MDYSKDTDIKLCQTNFIEFATNKNNSRVTVVPDHAMTANRGSTSIALVNLKINTAWR